MNARLFALLGCLLWIGSPSPSLAWGDPAHRIICEIAFQELEAPARERVKALVRLDPEFDTFAAACIWPDRPRRRAAEHFVNLRRDASGFEGITDDAGDWVKVDAGGLVIFRTTDERSNSSIEVACDEAMSLDHSGTGIATEIGGKMPPPNAQLSFTVDGRTITIPTDGSGGVRAHGCPKCAGKFAQLWALLREGDHLDVIASDRSRAAFSLRGTAELMQAEPCRVG